MERPTTVAIIGAGNRGRLVYAKYAKMKPDEMQVVAVAEYDDGKRSLLADEFQIPKERQFKSAQELFAQAKMADMAFICTQDRQHIDHALMAIEKGYDLLLEKPVSENISACKKLLMRARETNTQVTVCHVLRYAPFYQKAKEIIESGKLGRIINIEAAENVAYWHQSHSYVRGNWRRSDETSPMILAKCGHDMDLLVWLTDSKCEKVSSMGDRTFFRRENAPKDAPSHCLLGCPNKEECPYDAEKIYVLDKETGYDSIGKGWMQETVLLNPDREGLLETLKTSPYGRCVFQCDNNVVDHQVVQAQMENGIHISFTMSAFTKYCYRTLHIYGTKGELSGDLMTEQLVLKPFIGDEEIVPLDVAETISGHGGGDYRMLHDMFVARREGKATITGLEKSLESHFMALAAEESRINGGQMIHVPSFVDTF